MPHGVEPSVRFQQPFVNPASQVREPASVLHDAIEQITVRDPQSLAVDREVNGILDHFDTAEGKADELTTELVVVAWDVDDASAFARHTQEFLYDVVVFLWPVPALAQLPTIENVADQEKRLAAVSFEECE